jgi:hypothetical protein
LHVAVVILARPDKRAAPFQRRRDHVVDQLVFVSNAFGEKRSHGCINVSPEDAKWIFRWTTPYVSLAQSEMRVSLPDHGTIVVTREITL